MSSSCLSFSVELISSSIRQPFGALDSCGSEGPEAQLNFKAREVGWRGIRWDRGTRLGFFGAFCQGMLGLDNFLPTNMGSFKINPLKDKLLAGEQKAT